MDSSLTKKVIGYILLSSGLVLIALPIWQAYNIFATKQIPVEIIQIPAKSQQSSNTDIQQQVENALSKIVPTDSINKFFNLISWMILALIFMLGGKAFASIGLKILKD